MTPDEARALDVEVAQKIFGLAPCDAWEQVNFGWPALVNRGCPHENGACYPTIEIGSMQGPMGGAPRYSTRIQDAWAVWEKIAVWKDWEMRALSPENDHVAIWRFGEWIAGDCPAPEAICRAALKAVVESALT